jgi:nucleoside-diphosphate-sugar epimerase
MGDEQVLVTGGAGFVAVHCIVQLLQAGWRVRTTVRSPQREGEVRAMVAAGGADAAGLAFATADLLRDAGWAEAVAGCRHVLHVASPFPLAVPKDDMALITPAREGTLRVLRAARDAGVQRVVLTSSFAAVGYGTAYTGQPYTERDWTDASGAGVSAYVKSKTLAERAAWDFIAREGGPLELSVVNPVGIFGPALGKDISTSLEIIRRLLDGALPGLPNMVFGVVDVRDVAELHLRAMTDPAARGERFLAVAGDFLSMRQIAEVLKSRLGPHARRVPTRRLPDWLLRAVALVDPSVRQIVPELSRPKNATSEKARRVLGWSPRTSDEAIVSAAESLEGLGLLRG